MEFLDIGCRQPGGDRSAVLHPCWHKRPTLFGKGKLKQCRYQSVAAEPKTAPGGVGKIYVMAKVCTVRCCTRVAAKAYLYHLDKRHHVDWFHPSIQRRFQRVQVSEKDTRFVGLLTLRRGITSFLHEFWYCALDLGWCTCAKHRKRSINFSLNMHTFCANGIHSSAQPASCWLTVPYLLDC